MPLMLASGTLADWVAVGITAVGVIGVLITLYLSFRQLELQTGQLKRQSDLRTAQRALDLMRMLSDLTRAPAQNPELAPYFGSDAQELPKCTELRGQVLAHAAGYVSLAEAIGWQRHVEQLSDEGMAEWQKYFTKLYATTPSVKESVNAQRDILLPETLSLFESSTRSTIEVEAHDDACH